MNVFHDEFHEIQCPMSEIYNVKKNLEKIIANFISTEIEWVPLNNVDVEKDKARKCNRIFRSIRR